MTIVLLVSCAAVLVAALFRLMADRRATSVAVAVGALCYCVVFALGVLRLSGVLPGVDDRLTNQGLSYMSSYLQGGMAAVLGVVAVAVNVFVACSIWLRMRWWHFVVCVVAGFLLSACLLSVVAPYGPLTTLFGTCCAVMAATGYALGLTYKEFCVIGNNYVQAGLVLASAVWLATVAWRGPAGRAGGGGWWAKGLSSLLVFAYALMCCMVYAAYPLPLDSAFDACVRDLYDLAERWHTSYYHVNVVIYIVAFVAAIGANAAAVWLLRRPGGRRPAVALMALHLLVLTLTPTLAV